MIRKKYANGIKSQQYWGQRELKPFCLILTSHIYNLPTNQTYRTQTVNIKDKATISNICNLLPLLMGKQHAAKTWHIESLTGNVQSLERIHWPRSWLSKHLIWYSLKCLQHSEAVEMVVMNTSVAFMHPSKTSKHQTHQVVFRHVWSIGTLALQNELAATSALYVLLKEMCARQA